MPLAIELAAARCARSRSTEIVDSLHDRFRLLTGGARTAVRRQQTLRASVDWSHALLTEPERVLFRRLAAFMGGFDLDAAQAVAGDHRGRALPGARPTQPARRQVTRRRRKPLTAERVTGMLETVRQYALEKLGESGEADEVRTRHRDHFSVDGGAARRSGDQRPSTAHLRRRCTEIDNLRAAFTWSRENDDDLEGVGVRHVPAIGVARAGPHSRRPGVARHRSRRRCEDDLVPGCGPRQSARRQGTARLLVWLTRHPGRGASRSRVGDRPGKRRPGAA